MEAGLSSGSINGAGLEPVARRRWTKGGVTIFVRRHALAWELGMASLTVVYVVLAFFHDQGASSLVSAGVFALAAIFVAEFSLRLYDSESRVVYCRKHWLDIITCIPVVGPFRALRLLRLLAFVRLGATARGFGVGAAASDKVRGGTGIWVLAPILIILWVAASYGYYELEGGVNPRVETFTDALYFSFVTASTVGYGDVTPVTPAGKLLTGLVIFLGIGLLGFASAQLTAKLLPQKNELAELRQVLERQTLLIEGLSSRVEGMALVKESGSTSVAAAREAQLHIATTTRNLVPNASEPKVADDFTRLQREVG